MSGDPTLSLSTHIAIMIVGMLFSAGATWGLMVSRQKNNEKKQESNEERTDALVSDLKEAVKKLESVATDIQIMKIASERFDKTIEDHNIRISALELSNAKLTAKRRRG